MFRYSEISLHLLTEYYSFKDMKICILNSLGNESLSQIDSLLHQLSPSAPTDENLIVGMLTLTACQMISYTKYWIEDVIVDASCRGMGLGRALVKEAVNYVREKETSPVIYLTSNPSRVSARNLYRSEGFEEYETGVFRIK